MWELRKIDVLSLAKIYGVIGAIVGSVIGLITAIVGLAFSSIASTIPAAQAAGLPFVGLFGVLAIIIFPILYAIIGFVSGAVGAWLYNVVANRIGGVQLDLHNKSSIMSRIPKAPRKKK